MLILHFEFFCSEAYLGTGSIANPKYGGTGHVVCIEVLCLKGTESWKEFNEAVGQKWIEMGGVPHLAKQYDQLEGIFESTISVSIYIYIYISSI